jgi:hypothetical protein
LNRIQNIVAPSRRPLPLPIRPTPNSRSRWPFFRLILPSIFPLDLSSTYSRMVLRLPTMYYILKSLLLWSVLLLQASDHFPPFSWRPFQLLDDWASRKEMDEICWFTFRAICGALCVGALTRGLEGVGATNASPFNLVCLNPILSVFHPFTTICAVWLHLHAALLLFASDPPGKARRTALPTGRERYFYYLNASVSGKRHF